MCKSESDFDELVGYMKTRLICEKQRLFELREEAQEDWSPDKLAASSTYCTGKLSSVRYHFLTRIHNKCRILINQIIL